jgi:putative addiction module CopG family antidote
MAYQIPPDVDARVQAHLATGEFADVDAVIREALNALKRRQESFERLREMVLEAEEDVVAGRVGEFDAEATIAHVMRRLAAAGGASQ